MKERLRGLALLGAWLACSALLVTATLTLFGRERRAGSRIVVGSKRFTESVILAEIVAQELETHGIPVQREFFLGGTHICFQAVRSGAIDLYPEYTGTGLTAILGYRPATDPEQVKWTLRTEFRERYGLRWLDSLGFSDAYALAMPRRRAAALGIRRISDLVGRKDLTAGFASEFLARDDGWPGLGARYGLSFARGPLGMEAGLMYKAAALGQVDVISAYTTDGRLMTLDFVVLEDDKQFFPPYEASLVVREQAAERAPALGGVLARLSGRISQDEMQRMNAEVDDGRITVVQAARDFLSRNPPPEPAAGSVR
jgi:glycine betaine/choline ABC-type transport system substrate-binding protein